MLAPTSTRYKPKQSDKHINSARFFKKTCFDENEKNFGNFIDKLSYHNKPTHPTKKCSQGKRKKSENSITLASHKTIKTLASINASSKTGTIDLSTKESSMKNIKLTGSMEFPKIINKSISQTTMNKNM